MNIKTLIELAPALIELAPALEKLQPLLDQLTALEHEGKKTGMIGEYVIVRCRDAGVHSGYLEEYQGREVTLSNTRRLWYWKCLKEHSLSSIAAHGAHEDSKFATELSKITVLDACEIIPCTEESRISIMGLPNHDKT